MSDVMVWLNSLPKFTRYWFAGTVAVSVLARFGLLPIQYLVLIYEPFVQQFQIWRPITALFFYPLNSKTGFHFLINCYFLLNYSKLLETGVYVTRPADYAFMLLLNWFFCVIASLYMEMMVLMDPMVLSVLYVWCNLNAEQIVNFWFGTQFPAKYLPWVLFGLNFLISSGGISELIGIIVGHIYYFMKFQYPAQYDGRTLLNTPEFLENMFPPPTGGQGGFGAAPAQPRAGGGYSWGRGRPLAD